MEYGSSDLMVGGLSNLVLVDVSGASFFLLFDFFAISSFTRAG